MKARLILSLVIAIALVALVMVGIALARVESQGEDEIEVDTSGYTPKAIWSPGSYTFTYPIVAHRVMSPPATADAVITVTLDPQLQFSCATGTAIPPGDGGTVVCNGNQVVWSVTLTYCTPITLTLTAFKNVGTLELGVIETVVEWDGEREVLRTPLFLRRIYLPLVMRNFGP